MNKPRLAAARRWVQLWAAAMMVWGCTGSSVPSGSDAAALTQPAQPGGVAEPGPGTAGGSAVDVRELSRLELVEGPGALELAVSVMLRELGVVHLLESYLINIPPAAEFLFNFEIFATGTKNRHFYVAADAAEEAVIAFEVRMRQSARVAAETMPDFAGSGVLDEAFFEVLERCGRGSAWPGVALFELHDGRGFDVLPERVEPDFGISQFEYLQLRHECARHAATYPTLDPAERDRLLAPQRAHFARVILDRLDNELPFVGVPAEYQDQIDDLRRDGW